MSDSLSSPITEKLEVEALLDELPIAVKRGHFIDFVRGFPRKYLVATPRVEIVKHYFLMEGLKEKDIISSLSRGREFWKLSLVTRDRESLFSRICGCLSCFGMDIFEAQAFANAQAFVLDTFQFQDPEHFFDSDNNRRSFHYLMEEVIERKKSLEDLLRRRSSQFTDLPFEVLDAQTDNDSHSLATRLTLNCSDHFGLLYRISRCISEKGHDIVIAYVQTSREEVHNEFYLTHQEEKLTEEMQKILRDELACLGNENQILKERKEKIGV